MIRKLTTSAILFLSAITVFGQTVMPGVSASLAAYRHRVISRLTYDLSFTLPPDKTASIGATETIRFSLADATQDVQLDFRQDSSHVLQVTINGHEAEVRSIREHLVLNYRQLVKGINTVSISFIAGNESLNRNSDYLYALFVPDRARTVFPCFDQPDLKAKFRLNLTVPSGWAVLANGRMEDSLVAGKNTTYHFTETEPLPTYLFSFTAGQYAIADRFGMRLLYRETDTAKIRLSVDSIFLAHRAAINFLENWTSIAFPFQKIGFVAIPSFQFGGMEHPGEVQYNAGALFLDEAATRDQQIARSAVISHETAHMWFGDMVTMAWFNDVWMKEVFANFMADKVTEKLLGHETFTLRFLLDHTPAAYSIDRTAGANPIRQPLNNLSDAGSLYGSIIYHKAPIMMRQLESLMGKRNFQQGVREYLQKYKYGNARWDDLIALLARHTTADLRKWNNVWVNRTGRPVFSYRYASGKIYITQRPENGLPAVWPQKFLLAVHYPGRWATVQVDSRSATTEVAVEGKPDYVVFNSDGSGYGLFPAYSGSDLFMWQDPVQRAATYINLYENMLAGNGPGPRQLLQLMEQGFEAEKNELNLRLICGYAGTIYWNFLRDEERDNLTADLEKRLWNSVSRQPTANNKKIIFRTYQDVFRSPEAGARIYRIWQHQQPPDSIRLTEDDYTALAITIAIKNDTAHTVMTRQLERIRNPDRKARLEFLMPALSPDTATRDAFFISLSDPAKRHKEAWVASALAYMNHPLRQAAFVKFLPASLEMLQDVQRTGDVFFPQNWLNAIFPQYSSPVAWQVVTTFLAAHPGYHPKLREKILQATDNIYRAQHIRNTQLQN